MYLKNSTLRGVIYVSKKRRRYQRHHHRNRSIVCPAKDFHHFLWMRREWNHGWIKALREHPYCGALLPKTTLHRSIHEQIRHVPVPKEEYCFEALEAIQSWIEGGYISMDDSPERKLKMLIICFQHNSPDTAKALEAELKIISEFNQKPS